MPVGMELNEFGILIGQPGAHGHGIAVAGAGVGAGAAEVRSDHTRPWPARYSWHLNRDGWSRPPC